MPVFVRGGLILTVTVLLLLAVGWQTGLDRRYEFPSTVSQQAGTAPPRGQHSPPFAAGRLKAPGRAANDGEQQRFGFDDRSAPIWLENFLAAGPADFSRVYARSTLFAEEDVLPQAGGNPFPHRQKAPSLDGGVAWINTTGPIDLKQLRGKFVLLDFWTYCCINCMHILPVLKKLEHTFPNDLVVIGVHSAKFDAEQDSKNITDAVLRYDIEHPVINDRDHKLWEKFEVNSWPSLRVIDPEGYVVSGHSGEIDFESLEKFFKKSIPYYRKNKLLDETPVHFNREIERAGDTPLRFPGKVLADAASDRLFIADSAHNRIVIARLDGTLVDVVGSGEAGSADGGYGQASFDHPQGMAVAKDVLYVADTENHLLRRVDLKKRDVTTLAGTGKQGGAWPTSAGHGGGPVGKPRKTALSSPWALWIHGTNLYIAMAGPHQIWRMALPHGDIGPYAGNGREDIVDGPLLPDAPYEMGFASFAQPSGLTADDAWLYVADSEGSSIRAVPFDPAQQVRTVLGTSQLRAGRLFTFGDVDGHGAEVRLQHPLGVALRKGQLYVADTYNNKIKVIDLSQNTCQTLAGALQPGATDDPPRFDEPAGLSVTDDRLYVADTNNHAIRVIDLAHGNRVSTLAIAGLAVPTPKSAPSKPSFHGASQVKLKTAKVKAAGGKLRLHVVLELPPGYKMNELAPLRYLVEEEGSAGLVQPAALGQLAQPEKREPRFDIDLPLTAASGQTTLKVSCSYYYCAEGAEGLCKAAAVVWTVPVEIAADAPTDVVELTHAQRN
ncbi:MAG TPA: thioredoxin-like domain-containing protein [Pirellulales bacterium]|jgi:thiol-disulfide isomerase/thioredoxin|nr:thioredoxin-like domain-containing protein [Pirellulales bacterium]